VIVCGAESTDPCYFPGYRVLSAGRAEREALTPVVEKFRCI